jgi:hypothetical protein
MGLMGNFCFLSNTSSQGHPPGRLSPLSGSPVQCCILPEFFSGMFSLHSMADQCNGSPPQFLSGLNTSRLFPQVLMSLILGILCMRLMDWKIRRSQGSAFQMLTEMSWNKLILIGTANALLRLQFSNASESCSNSFGSHVHGKFLLLQFIVFAECKRLMDWKIRRSHRSAF